MDKKSRLRGPNFTTSDTMLLCDIMEQYKNIIENKKTDGVNLHQKQKAWQQITEQYNINTSGYKRTVDSLQQTYKNLKKKLKKNASDTKMAIPVDNETLLLNIEQHGTSSEGWVQVAENTGIPKEVCQETFGALTKQAVAKEIKFKRNIMRTGGGPPPNEDPDPVLEKVKVLVGPTIDGIFTIYDGDRDIMASQNKQPIEDEILDTKLICDPQTPQTLKDLQDGNMQMDQDCKKQDNYFTNDRANLKKTPHHLLKRKRKLDLETPSKATVAEKFKNLANSKMELVELQYEVFKTQLEDEKEKLEHNRRLRAMEMEETRKKYEHCEIIRKLELQNFHLNK